MRRVAAIGICLLLGTSAMASATPSAASARRTAANATLVTRAERLLARGRSGPAIALLRRAYARAPSLMLAHKLGAALWPEQGQMLDVKASAREQQSLSKRAHELMQLVDALPLATGADEQAVLRELWRRRASAQAWLGDLSGAIASLQERGTRDDDESARGLRRVAALAVQRDDLIAAELALLTARNFSPAATELSTDLAAVLLAQGRADESIPLWQERLKRDQNDLDARRDLAGALLGAGRGAEALQLLEAARAACDAAKNCAIEAARVALELGEPRKAIARLTGHFHADYVEAQFVLADAHARLGEAERAREAYARILEQRPGNLRARDNLRALEGRPQESRGD